MPKHETPREKQGLHEEAEEEISAGGVLPETEETEEEWQNVDNETEPDDGDILQRVARVLTALMERERNGIHLTPWFDFIGRSASGPSHEKRN